MSREFRESPNRAGIYAIQHRAQGILYLGKSGNVRARLRGGHKALGWAFIDRFDPDDVRIGRCPTVLFLISVIIAVRANPAPTNPTTLQPPQYSRSSTYRLLESVQERHSVLQGLRRIGALIQLSE